MLHLFTCMNTFLTVWKASRVLSLLDTFEKPPQTLGRDMDVSVLLVQRLQNSELHQQQWRSAFLVISDLRAFTEQHC